MQSLRILLLIVIFSSISIAQQSAPRNSQAAGLLQAALTAMGGTAPADSVATGTVSMVEGSTIRNGTIKILTRGVDQSAEHIDLSGEKRSVVHSRGQSSEIARGKEASSPELAASTQCPDFPLPILASVFLNTDVTVEYVREESLNGVATHHIRFWNTYGSNEQLRKAFAESTRKDLWLDAATGLPVKLAYERREAHGAVAPIRLEILYSDWRISSGINYPHRIEKTWNGIPWATITIEKVTFQNGLSDSEFAVKSQSGVR